MPIRGPGSLNREAAPALAVIEAIDATREVGLDEALDRLRAAVEAMGRDHGARAAQRALAAPTARPRQARTLSRAP